MSDLNPAIFREYDIRGVAERDFDAGFARRLGHAYARYRAGVAPAPAVAGRYRIGVGADCRLSSPGYSAALRAGLREAGIDVVDLGVCPTPLAYFALFELELDGAVQVTGSHNPADQNGFKICIGKTTVHGDQIQDLKRCFDQPFMRARQGTEERCDIVPRYQAYLAQALVKLPRPLRIVVDAGNATAGPVAPAIFRAMGCEVIELYCDMDGRFPNHHPDPTVEENLADLKALVSSSRADLGIAFDGDSDRLGVVSRAGRVIWGDELMVLFARDVLSRLPGATVVAEVKCSQRLFDDIQAHGGNPVMWKAGHSPIKAKMKETGAALGGEMSGHIFFADRYFGYDDGIYAAGRVLEILGRSELDIEQLLADLPPSYSTPEIRIDCPDALKFTVAERALAHFQSRFPVVTVDGVRVQLPHGWGLIRASNTQPAIVLRLEADSPEHLSEYRSWFERLLVDFRGDGD
ncbi:MAG: phosphomannomutase/phosphoglucomutase [Gemmatimonadota bacterium]